MSGSSIEARSSEDLELIRRLTISHDESYCVHTGSINVVQFQAEQFPPDLSIDETSHPSHNARMVQQELAALHQSISNTDVIFYSSQN